MSSAILTGTYANGVVLSNPATQDPATITPAGYVNSAGTATAGGGGTVVNGSTAAPNALISAAGGNAVNVQRAAGTVVNFGTIKDTGVTSGVGVNLANGGVVINQAGGLISTVRNAISV